MVPSIRKTYAIGALLIFAFILFEAYIQISYAPQACSLAYIERIILFAVTIAFLGGSLYQHSHFSKKFFALLSFLISLIGLGTAARHAWIQMHPITITPVTLYPGAFSSKISYYAHLVKSAYLGSPVCSTIDWRFIAITLPEWTCLFFGFLMLISIWQYLRISHELITK